MRSFKDGDTVTVEPWRAAAFPVLRDLVVDRGALDRIISAGGFISAPTGSAPDGNAIPVPKHDADIAMDAAECIGCGALRGGVSQRVGGAVHVVEDLAPRAPAAGPDRALSARARDGAPDGPRELRHLHAVWRVPGGVSEVISIDHITVMNRDFLRATIRHRRDEAPPGHRLTVSGRHDGAPCHSGPPRTSYSPIDHDDDPRCLSVHGARRRAGP
jgi:succinate dehydrogenase / fumarate reductase iron-sulfur subunit